MLNAWQPLLQIADLLLTHVFEAYFHRTVRSSIAFIIGSILERSRVRYYHLPWLEGWWQEHCTQHHNAVTSAKKSTLHPTFLNQDLHQLYQLLEYLPQLYQLLEYLHQLYQPYKDLHHHHIPSCQEVYITHQRTSGRGPGLVCAAANQRTGFHENSLRQKVNQAYKALPR